VAILCSQCGKALPRDDARFCNNCGAFAQPSVSHSQVSAPAHDVAAPPVSQPEKNKPPVLREQIALQPSARSRQRYTPEEPPSWMSKLDRRAPAENPSTDSKGAQPVERTGRAEEKQPVKTIEVTQEDAHAHMALLEQVGQAAGREVPEDTAPPLQGDQPVLAATEQDMGQALPSSEKNMVGQNENPFRNIKVEQRKGPVTWPKPVTHVTGNEAAVEKRAAGAHAPQEDFPTVSARLSAAQTRPSVRELHVKVWDQEDEPVTAMVEEQPAAQEEQSDLDLLPTRPMPAMLASPGETPVSGRKATGSALGDVNRIDDVERIDTVAVPVAQSKPTVPETPGYAIRRENTPLPVSFIPPQPAHDHPGGAPGIDAGRGSFPSQQQPPPVSPPAAQFIPASALVMPITRRPAKRRKSFLPLAIALTFLLAIAFGGWVVLYHPFSVASDSEPLQHFNDGTLGLSLQYPNAWTTKMERDKNTVHFFDSSQTAQVSIVAAGAATNDLAKYLQQQAAQVGMTGVKASSSLSFAGSTWQQVQGSVVISGANYSETILATVHGNHLYTWQQQAPQNVYADEERLVFSPMRASLQFTG